MTESILVEVFYLAIFLAAIIFLFWISLRKPKEGGRWARISARIDKRLDTALTRVGQLIGIVIFLFGMYLLSQLGLFGIILAIIFTLMAIVLCNFISKIKG